MSRARTAGGTMRGAENPLRPCGIEVGPYQIRERTDGRWVVADERLPRYGSVAWVCGSKQAAIDFATKLAARGAPVVRDNRPESYR